MKNNMIVVNNDIAKHADAVKKRFKELEVIVSKTSTEFSKLNDWLKNKFDDSFKPVQSAMLIPLLLNEKDELEVVLTVRHDNISIHKGEVVLPGGKQEQQDKNIIDTALRETLEEIGLMPDNVDILIRFIPILLGPRKGKYYEIHPIFGLIKSSFIPNLNPSEVSDIFTIPLKHFLCTPEFDSSGNPYIAVNSATFSEVYVIKNFVYGFLVVSAGLFYGTSPPGELFSRFPLIHRYWKPISEAFKDFPSKL